MKKTLLILLPALLLLLAGYSLSSCEQKLDSIDMNYTARLSSPEQLNFPNVPIPIKLSISGGDHLAKEEFTVRLSDKSTLNGFIMANTAPLLVGNNVKHKFDTPLNMTYTPNIAGEHKLIFELISTTSETNQEAVISISISEPAFSLEIKNKPAKLTLGATSEMIVAVRENAEVMAKLAAKATKAGGSKYILTARMKKGNGTLAIGDKVLFAASSQTKAAAAEVEMAKDEEMKMSFTSASAGDNVIEYVLSDTYSNQTNSTSNFDVESPAWELSSSFKSDSIYAPAQLHKFVLTVNNKNPEIPNEFTAEVNGKDDFLTRIFINGTYTSNGAFAKLKPGVNEISFSNPQVKYPVDIKLNVVDTYGNDSTYAIQANLALSDVKYKFSNTPAAIKAYMPYNFSGKLSVDPTSENKYTITNLATTDKVKIYLGDVLLESGKAVALTGSDHLYKLTADTVGKVDIPILIQDTYEQKFSTTLKLDIADNPLNITFTELKKIVFGNSQSATITIPRDLPHISAFTGRVALAPGHGGKVEINGQSVTDKFELKPGVNTVKITPSVVLPTFEAKLSIEASTGQIVEKALDFDLELPKLTVDVETIRGNSDMTPNNELLYTLKVDEPHYDANFTAQLTITSGAGTAKIGEKQITKDAFDLGKKGIYNLSIMPTAAVNLVASFRVTDKNGQYIEVPITGTVTAPVMQFTDNVISKELKYDTPKAFLLHITQPLQTVAYNPFDISNTALIKGVLKISDKVVEWDSNIADIKPGSINCEFTPTMVGTNTITFKAKDAKGKEGSHSITFNVTPYELISEVKNQSATTIHNNVPITFDLNISEEKIPAATHYKYKFVPVSGTGTLKLDVVPVISNNENNILSGTHKFSYTPTSAGNNNFNIEVTDIFGQKITRNIAVNVQQNDLSASVTSSATTIVTNPASLTLTANENNYTGNFTVKYTSDNTGTLRTAGGAVVEPNTATNVDPGNTVFTYTPATVGTHNVTFVVTDKYNQTKTVRSVVTAEKAAIVATPSVSSTSTTINSPAGFTANVTATGYKGNFALSYTGGAGNMMINGAAVNRNTSVRINAGANTFSYTPTTIGDHALTFTVTDDYGQNKQFVVNVTSNHIAMAFSAAFVSSSNYVGRPVNVNITASGATPLRVRYLGGNGTLTRNGGAVAQNTDVPISSNETWTYTPASAGSHALNFSATDANGQQTSSSTTLNSSIAALSASLSSTTANLVINNAATSTLSMSNQAGDSPLRVTWTSTLAGSMNIVSGNTYAAGNLDLRYTPTVAGTHTINVTVFDNHGQSKTVQWVVTARYADIVASADGFASTLNNGTATVSFNVSKEQYSGSFNVTMTSNKKGTTQGMATFNAGTCTMNYTPREAGEHTLTLTITDHQGGSKTISATVYSQMPKFSLSSTGSIGNMQGGYVTVNVNTSQYAGAGYPFYTSSATLKKGLSSGFSSVTLTKISETQYEVHFEVRSAPPVYGDITGRATVTVTDNYGHSEQIEVQHTHHGPTPPVGF